MSPMQIKSISLHAKYVSRGKNQSVAYNMSYAQGKTYTDKFYRKTFYGHNRNDLVHGELLLPEDAPAEYHNTQIFLDALNDSERRKDALMAINYILALPNELDEEERLNLARSFVQENFVKHGHPVSIAIHSGLASEHPKALKVQAATERCNNPHAHILVPLRIVGAHGFLATKYQGRSMCQKKFLYQLRNNWVALQNQIFERHGIAVRMTAHSYKDRGISREPTPHLGPWVEQQEAAGIKTERGEQYRQVLAANRKNSRKIEAQLKHESELIMERENEREITFER